MKRQVGLWIDHRQTVIVTVANEGEEIKRITSNEELKGRIVAVETVDKMTDGQIAAKVRQYFLA